MEQFFTAYGNWFWLSLAALLLVGELLNPGVFLMWFAAAAALTGIIHFIMPLGWTGEVLVFALLAFMLVLASWRWVSKSWNPVSDQPFLNQRQHALLGKTFPLHVAIVNGQGKIRFEDTLWDVDGPELPKSARVTVTGLDGMRLKVEPV